MPFEYFQIAPAAALSTTATDMARFMLAQLHGGGLDTARIRQEQSLQDMQRRQFTNDPHVNGVTFGFAEMRLNGQRLLVHSGTTNDERFRSLLALVPEQGIGLFVSYSGEGGGDAKWELLQAVLDHLVPAARPGLVTPPADFSARAHQHAGSYQSTRSVATTVEKIGALLAPAVTVQVEDNALLIGGLSREPTRWVELEPRVIRQIQGEERVVFRADTQGRITHLFQDNLPMIGFQRLAWYETLGLHYTILGGCALLFLTTVVGALVGWLRNRREHAPLRRPALLAHRLGWLVSAMYLIFLFLFVASVSDLTPLTLAALTIAPGASILVVAMGGFAIVAWQRSYWSLFGRLHYSVLALGALAFVWWLDYWNMLGYRL